MKKLFSLFAVIMMTVTMMAGRAFDGTEVLYLKASAITWWQDGNAVQIATFDDATVVVGVQDANNSGYVGFTVPEGEYSTVKFSRHETAESEPWNATGNIAIASEGNCVMTFAQNSDVATWGTYDPSHVEVLTYSVKTNWKEGGWGAGFKELTVNEDGTQSMRIVYTGNGFNVSPNILGTDWYPVDKLNLEGDVVANDSAIITVNPKAEDQSLVITITKIGESAGPEPDPEADFVTFTVTVPEGTKACYIAGNFNGWSFTAMTAGEGVYTYTTEEKVVAGELAYKYLSGAGWDYREVTAEGNDITNRSYQANDVVAAWKETYDPEAPVAPQDTIYFVNTLGWEHVYIHAWNGTGSSTDWYSCPELNKVDYQLKGYDVYMFEAIEGYYGKLLFKNASGDVAQGDDVRTVDLDWTSGKYYYKGLWMTRAEVEAPDPVLTYDTTMYVAGNFTEWAADMKELPYTVTLPADSALEFKQVRVVITYADEVEVRRDTVWYGQANKGNAMTRGNSALALDGSNNVLLTTDVEGEYTFALVEGIFTVTFPEMEEPKDPEYGIMVNGETFVAAVKNEEYVGEGEEWVVNVIFEGDELFQIYNKTEGAGWIIAQSESSQKTFELTEEEDNFVVADAGEYTLYIKIIYNADEMYVAYNDPSVKHYDYYLVGTAAVDGWDVTKAMPMENDEITRSLEAGTYEFKIINATIIAGEDPSWSSALDYDDLNTECSSEGVEGSSNVKFTLKEAGDVTIKVVEGTICVIGNFGEVVITVYTIAGQEALMGVDWKVDATENDLTKGEDGLWRLMKTDVELMAETYYYFKVVANHAWGVADYPETDANRQFMLDKDGVYDIEFVWNAEEKNIEINPTWKRALSATSLEMLMQDGAVKVLRGGNLYIIRDGKTYNATGMLVK